MSSRLGSLAGIVAGSAVAVALGGAPVAAARTAAVDYVALGDSYSSGVGAAGATGSCARSPLGYPGRWAASHAPASFRFVACGGATTADVRRAQLSALDAGTDLVSITIGGNDAGFFPTVMACVTGDDAACAQRVGAARTAMSEVLPGRLDATYLAIREQAPAARVVVLGYPRLFDPAAPCPTPALSPAERRLLNAAADELAAVIADRARAAGFTVADVRAPFDGHGVCAGDPWVNDLTGTSGSFHPNDAGYEQGYLPALQAAVAGGA